MSVGDDVNVAVGARVGVSVGVGETGVGVGEGELTRGVVAEMVGDTAATTVAGVFSPGGVGVGPVAVPTSENITYPTPANNTRKITSGKKASDLWFIHDLLVAVSAVLGSCYLSREVGR